MKTVAKLTLLLLLFAFVALAQTPAYSGDIFDLSIRDEKRIGADMYKESEKKWGFIGGDEHTHVDTIGQAIVKNNELKMFEKYTFTLLNEKSINAFATPGGYIYLHKGLYDLLKHDDNLIAAFLVHVIGISEDINMVIQYHRDM